MDMDSISKEVIALGTAIGAVLYAGVEVAKRVIRGAPKDDEALKRIEATVAVLSEQVATAISQIECLTKTGNAMASQIDLVHEDNDELRRRVDKIERNGRQGY